MRHRRAFTLIELLVVIAIIGILAALLFPALSKAKMRAQLATDVNNHRQILLATHMYAGDESDYMPRPGWKIPFSNWAYGDSFPYSTGDYDAVIAGQLAAVTKGQLYRYYSDVKILKCPADRETDPMLTSARCISPATFGMARSAVMTRPVPSRTSSVSSGRRTSSSGKAMR